MTFEFDGEEYAKASAHQKDWGRALIDELDLRGDELILDMGCGDGALTALLAERVPGGSVLGIDASHGMLDKAESNKRDNLEFRLMRIEDLDLSDEFDVIFSNATLHWVKDHARMLQGVARALKPGGYARLSFAGAGNCSRFFKTVCELMDDEWFRDVFTGFAWPWFMPSVETYEDLLAAAPFADAEVWMTNADRHFPDETAMIGWIDQPSLVPFREHLGEPLGGVFRDEVVRRMIARCREPDGRCFETFRRLNVKAVKDR